MSKLAKYFDYMAGKCEATGTLLEGLAAKAKDAASPEKEVMASLAKDVGADLGFQKGPVPLAKTPEVAMKGADFLYGMQAIGDAVKGKVERIFS